MKTDTRILNVERSTSTAHRLNYYDGVCGNIHGHNMGWEVDVHMDRMTEVDDSNMPLDLKDISDTIDEVDHALLLNKGDALFPDRPMEDEEGPVKIEDDALGIVWGFEGDPTCELVSEWMAENIGRLSDYIVYVEVTCNETDKYSVTGEYSEWL